MSHATDVVVVGGGIVGLALAHRLLEDRPGLRVVVCEKERELASHQTSHNSGVVHAGLYYTPGSLKARLCREGSEELIAFCRDHGVPIEVTGKLVVAVDREELPRLHDLEERARANGVPGLRAVDADGIRAIEPHAGGIAGLHSPTTAVTDFRAVALALAERVRQAGGEIATGAEAVAIHETAAGVQVTTTSSSYEGRAVVACAGLQSDRVAALTHGTDDVRIVPFRGSYRRLRTEATHLVRGNIYPVPDPRFPFLGVHLSRRISGEVWIGPNALLALAREDYRREAVSGPDLLSAISYPGFWRMARRTIRTGGREAWHELVGSAYLRQVQRYVPALTKADVLPGPNGIRAQTVRADGSLVDDFLIERIGHVVHVRNAPSPAATASFAIAREIARPLLASLS